MARAHAIAAVIEDPANQQCVGLRSYGRVIVQLFRQLRLDGIEQSPIDDGGLFSGQDLAFEDHLSNIEAIAKYMREHAAPKRNAPHSSSCLERPDLGDEATFAEVRNEEIDAAKFEVAPENGADQISLGLVDRYPPVLGIVAKRDHASDPQALAFGSGDLVPDAFGGDLALELGKRQQHV